MFGGRRRRLPQDGTFNQTQPFDRLVGSRHSFSFDLKSATDRWPLVFLFEVVQYLFDRSFASSVVNSAFACNIFEVPFVKLKRRFSQAVSYTHLRAHETLANLVCRLLLEKKKQKRCRTST